MIESRTLFEDGDFEVIGSMLADLDNDPDDQDFENPAQRADYLARYQRDDFTFVGMSVEVMLSSKVIGRDDLWGIEHGTVAEGVEADAWENTPAEYPEPNHVVGGSPLNSVINAALGDARKWLEKHQFPIPPALVKAEKWADPNNVKEDDK